MDSLRVWVIGASSGLGAAIARALAAQGHRVYASARSFPAQPLQAEGMTKLHLDVTDPAEVEGCALYVLEAAGSLDALIYCPAQIVLGSCEHTGAKAFERVMDVGFFGLTRVVAGVLPAMRAQGSGRIVLLSSINGLLGIPFTGAYVAAKHALEGYAECLRLETEDMGIEVCVVRPGDHRGGGSRYRQKGGAAQAGSYPAYGRAIARIAADEAAGRDPEELAKRVCRLLKRRKMPGTVLVAGAAQRLAVYLHDLLPTRPFAAIIRKNYLK